MHLGKIFKKHLNDVKAEQKDEARSRAIRIKSLDEIQGKPPAEQLIARKFSGPTPTDVIIGPDKTGKYYRYWSDGSLRRHDPNANA